MPNPMPKYGFRRSILAACLLLAAPMFSAADHHGGGHSMQPDIVATAQAAGTFETLVAAVGAAGLVTTLEGEGPFTVFAPTDAAFAALPAGTVEMLLEPANKARLVAILTYHVVPGKVMSGDLAGKTLAVETVEGSEVDIDASGASVMVDDARVVTADIEASNGVIHVIDKVIMP
ncbi:MAG TPA: fasciclin domain-containing protein [Pseudomonadales bacterium]|nr:fasciclin domain-containing protein [Pseudomonadales bacterium]